MQQLEQYAHARNRFMFRTKNPKRKIFENEKWVVFKSTRYVGEFVIGFKQPLVDTNYNILIAF